MAPTTISIFLKAFLSLNVDGACINYFFFAKMEKKVHFSLHFNESIHT